MNKLAILLWYYFKHKYLFSIRSRQNLVKWQRKKIKYFTKRITMKSKFYKKYYASFNLGKFDELPTIDKNIMMENFNELNTVGIDKEYAFKIAFEAESSRDFSPQIGNITVGLSSGTSGNRGVFLASAKERAIWAGVILAKTLPNGILHKEKIAFFLRSNSNLYESVTTKIITFKFFDLLHEVEEHIGVLNEFKPTILVAPPSMLRMLAQAKNDGNLFINPIKIISVAEVLESIDEAFIKLCFCVDIVHQVYQCTEGFLGVTCKYGTLHLNEDLVCIQKEYIDKKNNKFIPIISDFTRISQPIIRYRLNDILIEKTQACPCGSCFTAIETIEGRTDDIFYIKDKNNEHDIPIFPDFFRRAVMTASDDIIEYKVIQRNYNLLEVYLKLNGDKQLVENAIKRNLYEIFDKMNTSSPKIVFYYNWCTDKGKKLKRIERIGM